MLFIKFMSSWLCSWNKSSEWAKLFLTTRMLTNDWLFIELSPFLNGCNLKLNAAWKVKVLSSQYIIICVNKAFSDDNINIHFHKYLSFKQKYILIYILSYDSCVRYVQCVTSIWIAHIISFHNTLMNVHVFACVCKVHFQCYNMSQNQYELICFYLLEFSVKTVYNYSIRLHPSPYLQLYLQLTIPVPW